MTLIFYFLDSFRVSKQISNKQSVSKLFSTFFLSNNCTQEILQKAFFCVFFHDFALRMSKKQNVTRREYFVPASL